MDTQELEQTQIQKIEKDILKSARTMREEQVRYLADTYYSVQDYRIQAKAQIRMANADGEPHELVAWTFSAFEKIEKQIKRAMLDYASSRVDSSWAMSIHGIGPVLAAGLVAHFDISKAPTVGHFWRFAGLDTTNEWIGKDGAKALVKELWNGDARETFLAACQRLGRRPDSWEVLCLLKKDGKLAEKLTEENVVRGLARRPWNAKLKVLCWKIGESFCKLRGSEKDIYGKVYEQRKQLEIQRNEAGMFKETAERALTEKKWNRDNTTRQAYRAGKLPDGRIDLRAKRYAVKLFLSHLHHVMYEVKFNTPPPKPYILTRPEHAHFIAPPNWPMRTGVPDSSGDGE
jgi:hypothetical protein